MGTATTLDKFFAHGPTVIYATDASDPTRFKFVSANVENHFGYKPEEIVGDAGFRLATVHPEDKSNLLRGIDVLRKASSLSQTYRIRRKDGSYRWVQDDLVLLNDRNGEKSEFLGYLLDITVRKKSEEALRESEQKFRSSFNNSTIAMTIVELEGQFQQVNPAFCEFLGYSEKELLKKTIQDITHPGDRGATKKDRRRLIRGDDGDPTLEKRYIHKDGHEIWGLTSRSVVKDARGNPLHSFGQIVDITARKKVEEEQHRRKTLFEAIFRDVPDAMLLADTDRTIIMCNPAFEKVFGYASEEVLGRQADVLYENREEYERQGRNRFNLSAKERLKPYQVNYKCKNGEIFAGETVGTVIQDENGGPLAYMGVIRDVTRRMKTNEALRESEEQFRRSFDNVRVGLAWVDPGGDFLRVNAALARMLGYPKREMIGCVAEVFFHPDDMEKIRRPRGQVISGKKRSFTAEVRYLHKKGHIVWGHLSVTAIRDRQGRVLYTVGQVRDLTKQRKAEDALRQSEIRFKDFASTAADRFWETDQHHRFTYISTSVEKNLHPSFDDPVGKTRWEDDPIGKARWERLGIDGNDEIWARHREVLEAHRPFRNFRYTVVNPSGDVRYLKSGGNPLFDENGAFAGYRGTSRDETEEMEAKEKAVDLQSRFHFAMENISEGFVLYDADDRFVACNTHFLTTRPDLSELLVPGARYEEIIRHQAENGHFPSAEGRIDEWLAERIEEHHQPSSGYEMMRDGRWYRMRKQKLADGSIITFHLDITEMKQREAALRESEETAQAFMNSTLDTVALFEPDGKITTINDAFADRFNKSKKELLGTNVLKLFPKKYRKPRLELFGQVVETGRPIRRIEISGERWIDANLYPVFDGEGKVRQIAVSTRDITDQKKAEQALEESEDRFRSLFEKSAVGMALVDRDSRLRLVNSALCDFLGYSKEELEQRTLKDISHPDDMEGTLRHREQLLKENTDRHHWEKRYVHKDGRTLWGHASTTVYRDAEGRPAGVIGVVQDISGTKEAQRDLIQASKLATLGEMAAGMAHELNQPLQIIRIAADHCLIKIEKGLKVDPAISSRLDRVAEQTSRMAQIIDHMQVFGRIDSSENQPFNPVESIGQAAKLVLNELHLADIEVSTVFPRTCRQVRGHSVQFEQVIVNLLTNARDAIASKRQEGEGDNAGQIEISVEDDRDNDWVRILVYDDGGSIPGTVMERLFDPFFTTKDTGKGMGLGLSISYGIIETMGGKIIAANMADGVQFAISLPAAPTTSPAFPSIEG